jgi:glycine cleavage system H protein
MKKYAKTHEYVLTDGESAKIGISQAAAAALDEIVQVLLPNLGDKLVRDESFCSVEGTKTLQDVLAPVDGEVIGVNAALTKQASLITEDPEGEGRIVEIKMSDPRQLDSLLDSDPAV